MTGPTAITETCAELEALLAKATANCPSDTIGNARAHKFWLNGIHRARLEITDELPSLIATIRHLSEALRQWKCGSCGGSGIYKNKFMRAPDEHVEEEVPCKVCDGKGLNPLARAALNSGEG